MTFHHIAVLNETFNQLTGQSTVTTAIAVFPIITNNAQIAHSTRYGTEHTAGAIAAVHRGSQSGNGKALSIINTGKSAVCNILTGMVQFGSCCHTNGHIAFNTAHVDIRCLTHIHFAEETAVYTFCQGHEVLSTGYLVPAFGILFQVQAYITDNIHVLFLGNEMDVADIHFHIGSCTQVYTQELACSTPVETLTIVFDVHIFHCPFLCGGKVEMHFTTAGNGREEELCIDVCG